MITKDNVCKLSDFGNVYDLNSNDKSGVSEGDSRYVAPELMDGNFCKASDVFSLGITMLELASYLELPQNGDAWQELRNGIFPVGCMRRKLMVKLIKLETKFHLFYRYNVGAGNTHQIHDGSKTPKTAYGRQFACSSENPKNYQSKTKAEET